MTKKTTTTSPKNPRANTVEEALPSSMVGSFNNNVSMLVRHSHSSPPPFPDCRTTTSSSSYLSVSKRRIPPPPPSSSLSFSSLRRQATAVRHERLTNRSSRSRWIRPSNHRSSLFLLLCFATVLINHSFFLLHHYSFSSLLQQEQQPNTLIMVDLLQSSHPQVSRAKRQDWNVPSFPPPELQQSHPIQRRTHPSASSNSMDPTTTNTNKRRNPPNNDTRSFFQDRIDTTVPKRKQRRATNHKIHTTISTAPNNNDPPPRVEQLRDYRQCSLHLNPRLVEGLQGCVIHDLTGIPYCHYAAPAQLQLHTQFIHVSAGNESIASVLGRDETLEFPRYEKDTNDPETAAALVLVLPHANSTRTTPSLRYENCWSQPCRMDGSIPQQQQQGPSKQQKGQRPHFYYINDILNHLKIVQPTKETTKNGVMVDYSSPTTRTRRTTTTITTTKNSNDDNVCTHYVSGRVLLITRYDYCNIYFVLRDWFQAFLTLSPAPPFSSHNNQDTNDVSIIFLDGHAQGALDPAWRQLFGPTYFIKSSFATATPNTDRRNSTGCQSH